MVVEAIRLRVVAHAGQLLLAHAPARGRVVVQALETLLLRVLAHVHEELHHHVAVVHELLLEVGSGGEVAVQEVDVPLVARPLHGGDGLLAGLLPVLAGAAVRPAQRERAELRVQQVLRGGRVPAAVVERHGAARAERAPELLHDREEARHPLVGPRESAGGLHVQVLGDVDARGARVQVVHEVGDAAALAGAVPALEQHHQPHALLHRFLLQHHELLHERVATRLVLLFGQRGT